MTPMALLQAQAKYGEIQNGVWGEERRHCSMLTLPPALIFPDWINSATGKPVERIYCLNDMQRPLTGALTLVLARRLDDQLKTFDGCKNMRLVRGSQTLWSSHAYGGAIDINAATNPLGTLGDMSAELAACFTENGFIWGKRFTRMDPQHFSYLGW